MNQTPVHDRYTDVMEAVRDTVIIGEDVLQEVLIGFFADGHVLLEDVPGTGKTLTARSIAEALGLSFSRIQFTPDLLPADITGSEVFNEGERTFEFKRGPLFANIVLADEINRASPKTQSALLEAMAERQVSVGNDSYPLPDPFFVIATQNPIESAGTFELPEAQLDRFMIKTQLGYPDADGELEILNRRADRTGRSSSIDPVCTARDIEALRQAQEEVHVRDEVRKYIVDVVRATRNDERVETGVSPRGTERLFEATRTAALVRGRDYATPDDTKKMMRSVLAHRLSLSTEARVNGVQATDVIADIDGSVAVPKLIGNP